MSNTSSSNISIDNLCKAIFQFHDYHLRSLLLDNINEVNSYQEARKVITASNADVLSTPIAVSKIYELYPQFEQEIERKKLTYNYILSKHRSDTEVLPVHLAAFVGNKDIMNFFLQRYPEGMCRKDSSNNLPIIYAVLGGCTEVVKILMNEFPEGIRTVDDDGELPIHIAAGNGYLEITKLLSEAHPEGVSTADHSGRDLPVHFAACNGPHTDVVNLLIHRYPDGARVKTQHDSSLPIHYAASEGHVETVRLLLDFYPEGASIGDEENYFPIHLAAMKGRVDVLKVLIEKIPNAFKSTSDGELPLHVAAQSGKLEATKFLYELYRDGAFAKNSDDNLPIHCAAENWRGDESLEVIKFFVYEMTQLIQSAGRDGKLPIHMAAEKGSLEITKFLLHKYPDGIFTKDSNGNLPIHCAAFGGMLETTKLLFDLFSFGLQYKNDDGESPLYLAMPRYRWSTFYSEVAVFIIEKNINASSFGHKDAGGLFDQQDDDDNNPLPLWERKYSPWAKLKNDEHRKDVLQAYQDYPIVQAAIGKIPLNEIQFIIEKLQIDLASSLEGQTTTIAIQEASKNEAYWSIYFKPLLQLINSRIHKINVEANPFSARGNDEDETNHNILHNAALNGLPWYGMKDICEANYDELIIPNAESGLLPFMLASEGLKSDLTVVYNMLLMRPGVMEPLIKKSDENNYERESKKPRLA